MEFSDIKMQRWCHNILPVPCRVILCEIDGRAVTGVDVITAPIAHSL